MSTIAEKLDQLNHAIEMDEWLVAIDGIIPSLHEAVAELDVALVDEDVVIALRACRRIFACSALLTDISRAAERAGIDF